MHRWTVIGKDIQRWRYRWYGRLLLARGSEALALPMTGTVAQWFRLGEEVEVEIEGDAERPEFDNYRLFRETGDVLLPVWPVYEQAIELARRSPVTGEVLYTYRLRLREATHESDYVAIVDMEQHHYAAEASLLAAWYCPQDGIATRANLRPRCPCCRQPMRFRDLVDATRASRFLVAELIDRQPYEPKFIGYVRVDPPLPIMHRRLPSSELQRHIRSRVFPPEWFAPTYWPERHFRELSRERPGADRAALWAEAEEGALQECDTQGARIARVVVHPDYRGEGLGYTLVECAVQWVVSRRIPEMRRPKALVETVAMMARYNPFFERAGFRYLWDTASGRPVLFRALTVEAEVRIEQFLDSDPVASQHRGRLYRPALEPVEALAGPIRFERVTKVYRDELSLRRLPDVLKHVLRAFGVERRVIEKYVLRNLNLEIASGEIVALTGASGAGKTTLLRLLCGAVSKQSDPRYLPDSGRLLVPANTHAVAFLPGEIEPDFAGRSVLEAVYSLVGDEVVAIEILNAVGLSDAVLFRATLDQLSTGQRERALLAYLLATGSNLVLIDEFCAHLDALLAQRVARKLGALARRLDLTLVVSSHRQEALATLEPDRTLLVGYGGIASLT